MSDTEVIRAAALTGVAHGFLGRKGGVSTGVVAGLNVGMDDDANAVAENRLIATRSVLPSGRLVTLRQVHSADAVTVLGSLHEDACLQGDALVTNAPGLALGILTADCAPVLLADVAKGVIGAAHAGWKGALSGVTDATILAMEALGARRGSIVAAIGPCIAQASYEIDEGFRDRFLAADPAGEAYFADGRPGHAQFDLEAYVAHRLRAAEIGRVEMLALDTYGDEARFFSYRRATHIGQASYGRQISIIGLE